MSVKSHNSHQVLSSRQNSRLSGRSSKRSESVYYTSQINYEATLPSLFDKYSEEIDEIELSSRPRFLFKYVFISLLFVSIVN